MLARCHQRSLSTDQKYLYAICQAVVSGYFPVDLIHKCPGKMAHSRWLTTANRILRHQQSRLKSWQLSLLRCTLHHGSRLSLNLQALVDQGISTS